MLVQKPIHDLDVPGHEHLRPTTQPRQLSRIPRARLALVFISVMCGFWGIAACGSDDSQETALSVGRHVITRGEVDHWTSVLVARIGNNGRIPPPPIPPDYKACVHYEIAYGPRTPSKLAPSQAQLKSTCDLEYRRYKLKALYLLISYQWVTGQAAELGVNLDRSTLDRQFAAYKQLFARNGTSFQRYLRSTRATASDIRLSFELEQLTRATEAKVGPQELARFGEEFKRRWRARTDCRSGYIVPVCRQYKPPKTPPDLVPPQLPFTGPESPAQRIQ